jgi:hypothetical protein
MKTQMEVSKEHLATLQTFLYWAIVAGRMPESKMTVCPNCNRDAVKCMDILSTFYVDDCFFDGHKWKLKSYCEVNSTGSKIYRPHLYTRRVFKHE